MSIKFGMLTNPASNILEEVKVIKKLGFDYPEMGIEPPGGDLRIILKNVKKLASALKTFPSPAIAHTPWWIDFSSGYEPIRKAWVEEGRLLMDTARKLNIDRVNFHFFHPGLAHFFKEYHKIILANITKSLKEIVDYAERTGMTVFLENVAVKKSISGITDYAHVVNGIPGLKVHLDIGHAFVENGMKGIKDYIFAFKDKLEHVHLHDNGEDEDDHLPLGKGKIDFEQVARWLRQVSYDKTITMEVFTSKEDAKDSMGKFRQILKNVK